MDLQKLDFCFHTSTMVSNLHGIAHFKKSEGQLGFAECDNVFLWIVQYLVSAEFSLFCISCQVFSWSPRLPVRGWGSGGCWGSRAKISRWSAP